MIDNWSMIYGWFIGITTILLIQRAIYYYKEIMKRFREADDENEI